MTPKTRTVHDAAQAHLDALAKPPGSLAAIETLAVRIAAAQRRIPPTTSHPRTIVFAGDHGVARAWPVSPYPPEVTHAMVHTFAAGRAAVAALARVAGATLEVIDCGVNGLGPIPASTGVLVVRDPVGAGTADLVTEPAMTPAQCAHAVQIGTDAANRAHAAGCDILALGEMGIGNTTSASALAAQLLNLPAADVVGPGTGLDADGVRQKAILVDRALQRSDPATAMDALADLGGFEIAALVGCMLQATALRIPILLDGFIVSAAALVAVRHNPLCREILIPTTLSAEPGHQSVLAALDVGTPLLDMGLRLGEASAATLSLPLARAACAVYSEMATLASVLEAAP